MNNFHPDYDSNRIYRRFVSELSSPWPELTKAEEMHMANCSWVTPEIEAKVEARKRAVREKVMREARERK